MHILPTQGRFLPIVFLNIVEYMGATYQIVTKNESDTEPTIRNTQQSARSRRPGDLSKRPTKHFYSVLLIFRKK